MHGREKGQIFHEYYFPTISDSRNYLNLRLRFRRGFPRSKTTDCVICSHLLSGGCQEIFVVVVISINNKEDTSHQQREHFVQGLMSM